MRHTEAIAHSYMICVRRNKIGHTSVHKQKELSHNIFVTSSQKEQEYYGKKKCMENV